MKLSVELFRRTVDQLRGGSTTQRSEKRLTPRIGLRCRIELLPIISGVMGKPIEVLTRDISRSGIGIISGQKMKLGDHFLIRVPYEESAEKPLAFYCTVRSCHELSKTMFSVGCSFENLREKQSIIPQAAPAKVAASPEPVVAQKPAATAAKAEHMLDAEDEERIRKAILS